MLTLGASFRFLLDGSMDRLGEEARRDEGDEERAGGPWRLSEGEVRAGRGLEWDAELNADTTASRAAAATEEQRQRLRSSRRQLGGFGRWQRGSESKTTAGWEEAEMR